MAPKSSTPLIKSKKLDKVARRSFGLKDDNPYIGFSLNVLNIGSCDIDVRDKDNS
jgi:hypothetical protein